MTASSEGGWDRVAIWLDNEISAKGWSLSRIERESGVSFQTLKKLLEGQPVTRRERLTALAHQLGYRHDTFDRLRAGEEPIVLHGPDSDEEVDDRLSRVEEGLTQVREGLAAVVRRLDEGADSP